MLSRTLLAISFAFPVALNAFAQETPFDTSRGDQMLAAYFRTETLKLSSGCLEEIQSLEDWNDKRGVYRQQLLEMLGLDPLPSKTDLKVTVTGTTDHEDFTVQRLHYQSRPGLYVTANLYVPKDIEKPLPAILYVCGHARVRIDNVDYGNKAHYQHHAGWFARNGYVCLTIDTLQLGEIEGIHHGTYREHMWWWLNRGYTPAGVEAWNCVRAIDLLQTLDEVDSARIGVTGRSGGGVYSWWLTAIDDRIKCAVPVAGITDLQNHVVDGCVEGHCDCMFMVNTYRWDYPQIAALVAPRPLLISNTDSDGIFPLDGVYRTFEKVRRIYELHDAKTNVAFHITAGPHQDTQELRIHAFRWMNKHLKGDDSLVEKPAVKFFQPEQLKVFDELPADERNSKVQESFSTLARPELPASKTEWEQQRAECMGILTEKVFGGWPRETIPLNLSEAFETSADRLTLKAIDFTSQEHVRLRLFVTYDNSVDRHESVELNILDKDDWKLFLATLRPAFGSKLTEAALPEADELAFLAWARGLRNSKRIVAYLAPRGVGPTAWDQSERKQIQNRRRFYLLGQTLDGMQTFDVKRAVQALRTVDHLRDMPLTLRGRGSMAGNALYASLFAPTVSHLSLVDLPASHRQGPFYLNVRRFLDMPQALTMALDTKSVSLHTDDPAAWQFAKELSETIGAKNTMEIVVARGAR